MDRNRARVGTKCGSRAHKEGGICFNGNAKRKGGKMSPY
jgi:hypothetical protein